MDDEEVEEPRTDERETHPSGGGEASFPVVGVGSSSGGLKAIQELLEGLGPEPGVCLVALHHTDPDHGGTLRSILEGSTELPVVTIEEGQKPVVDTVMVVPPGKGIELRKGLFRLETVDRTVKHDVIDRFLSSLADEKGARSMGVVLSGALTDGALGLRDVQLAGGLTFAQEESTAQTPSMPRNAIAAGHVDFELPPGKIGERISKVGREQRAKGVAPVTADTADPETLDEIFRIVREATGVDFSTYKSTTLARRIDRRRMARGAGSLEEYLSILQEDPDEARILHDESLIHVTGFFRDPEIFEALREEAFPRFEEIAEEDPPIRVWVPGCATGEEAYSLAIALHEYLDEQGIPPRIQVFGTDLSEEAVQTARDGTYPRSIEEDLSPERLSRFFRHVGKEYRVRESIRNQCIFARHDLIQDPPFFDIDLVSCRNLLIYLKPDLQERATVTLHYALADEGVLVLGPSESLDRAEDLFTALDSEHRIFRRKDVSPAPYLKRYHPRGPTRPGEAQDSESQHWPETPDLKKHADRLLLDAFAPPGVVLDEALQILQFRGDVGRYLSPVEGQASLQLTRVAPHKLALAVRSLVEEAKEEGRSQQAEGVKVETADAQRTVTVRVLPIRVPPREDPQAYLALFLDERYAQGTPEQRSRSPSFTELLQGLLPVSEPGRDERVEQLEDELEATRRYLESVIEEYEATNEELRSANEEALSTNEELATAKEELQSANEELSTLNEELKERNDALQQLNDDLRNFLQSVELPILMLDSELKIRRYTPPAEELFSLRDGDQGRPLTELQHPFQDEDLETTVQEVLDSLQLSTLRVTSEAGETYELRVRPYRTQDDEIAGAVLVFWGPSSPSDA